MATKPTAGAADPALVASLSEELGRELSARTVLFHQAIADRLGLGLTDHKCLDIAHRAGPAGQVTAGHLAELTGLTTGAITGVLDRLEKAGFVRREKDPADRRQVLVRFLPDRAHELQELFEPMARGWAELCARYSEKELILIRDFMRSAGQLTQRETERLRAEGSAAPQSAAAPVAEGALFAPLGHVKRGFLEFPHGASHVTLGASGADVLYRARFEGPPPKLVVHEGRLTVEYNRSALRLFDWRRQSSTLDLNPTIPWSILIRSGASNLEAHLQALHVTSVEVRGGVSEASITLPRPTGTVAVRIGGGANRLRVVRPAGVPARVRVGSGASGLTIDTLQLGSVGGETKWESPDFASAQDRYDIEIGGGASGLTVTTDTL